MCGPLVDTTADPRTTMTMSRQRSRKMSTRKTGQSSCLTPDDFVRINVCGCYYDVLKSTLEQFPNTLLGNIVRRGHYYVDFMKAYYFDRNRETFEAILYYYQSGGTLIRPTCIPMDLFIQETRFYGIAEETLLNLQAREGYVRDIKETGIKLPDNPLQRKIWELMELPDSSIQARLVAFFSTIVILVSITTFCLETVPGYHAAPLPSNNNATNPNATASLRTICTSNSTHPNKTSSCASRLVTAPLTTSSMADIIEVIDAVCITWFTGEYLVRFFSSPRKWVFFRSFLNLIDLCAILPYYVILAVKSHNTLSSNLGVIKFARLIRVLRVFKLSRHSLGLQVLGSTLKASVNELFMIMCMMSFSIIIFSSAIYYAEHEGDKDTFSSIPEAFWFTLVTMTTVGYGDYVPRSLAGKFIGGACAVNGVLVVAMVVPVIVNNFEFFYKRDRISRAKKEERRLSYKQLSLGDALPAPKKNSFDMALASL